MGKEVYSLWLCPEGDILDKYRALVGDLASRFNTPVFEPHITVVPDYAGEIGSIKARLASALSAVRRPLTLKLSGPHQGESYYRCVYDLAEITPDLENIFGLVRKEFGPQKDLFPHLSLAYGDLSESVRQEAVDKARELKHQLQIPDSFIVQAVTVFFTGQYAEAQNRMSSWHPAGKVPFTSLPL